METIVKVRAGSYLEAKYALERALRDLTEENYEGLDVKRIAYMVEAEDDKD